MGQSGRALVFRWWGGLTGGAGVFRVTGLASARATEDGKSVDEVSAVGVFKGQLRQLDLLNYPNVTIGVEAVEYWRGHAIL